MTPPQIGGHDPTAREASVARLFRELGQREARYAVPGNYECLPALRRRVRAAFEVAAAGARQTARAAPAIPGRYIYDGDKGP